MKKRWAMGNILTFLPLITVVMSICGTSLLLDPSSFDPTAVKPVVAVWFVLIMAILCLRKRTELSVTIVDVSVFSLWLVSILSEWLFPPAAFGPVYPYTVVLIVFYTLSRLLLSDVSCTLLRNGFIVCCVVISGGNILYWLMNKGLWYGTFIQNGRLQYYSPDALVGTMANSNYLASVLLLFLPLIVLSIFNHFRSLIFSLGNTSEDSSLFGQVSYAIFLIVAGSSLSLVLYLSFCRSAWVFAVCTVFGMVFYLTGKCVEMKRSRRFLLCFFVVALGSVVLFFHLGAVGKVQGKSQWWQSINSRMAHWECALQYVRNTPFSGWGPGGYERVYCGHLRELKTAASTSQMPVIGQSSVYVHNFILQIGGSLGLQSLFIVAMIVFPLLRCQWKGFFSTDKGGSAPENKQVVCSSKRKRSACAKDTTVIIESEDDRSMFQVAVSMGILAFLMDNLINVSLFVFPSGMIFLVFLGVFARMESEFPGERLLIFHFAAVKTTVVLLLISILLMIPGIQKDYESVIALKNLRSAQNHSIQDDSVNMVNEKMSRSQWYRYTYDYAGSLAVHRSFLQSLALYSIVSGHVPFYQSVETNKKVVRQLLSQD